MAIQHGIVEKMEPDNGKLFIGGISWDTDEERLKEYFSSYGEVVEAVIMRDRLTGRARGFGFVVFLDPAVAQRVVTEKHMIDGRTVEAKKAVPREDHHGLTRNISTIQGSPGPTGPTKKIFVGGLPSTVTENDFKLYFDQFGNITDVVVMYDHNTQRPRGFGFITFDSEEAVDRVLFKTFHELNGKMVEVKRAVPKESTPSPARIPLIGYNNNYLNRPNNLFTSSYPQGYNMGPIGSYGVRMDSRFSPIVGRGNGYNMGMNLDPDMSPNAFGGSENNMGYGRVLGPYFGGTPNRYSTPIGYNQGGGRNGPQPIGSSARNVWGNGGHGLTSPGGSGSFMGSGSGFGVFGNNVTNWGSLPLSSQNGGNIGGFRGEESNYGLVGNTVGRNNVAANGGQQGYYGNFNRGGSMYGDATWQSSSNEINGSDSFGNRRGNAEDVVGRNSEGYVGNYNIGNRQSSREIAA